MDKELYQARPDDVAADEFEVDGRAVCGRVPGEELSKRFAAMLAVSGEPGDVRSCKFQGRLSCIDMNRHAHLTAPRRPSMSEYLSRRAT